VCKIWDALYAPSELDPKPETPKPRNPKQVCKIRDAVCAEAAKAAAGIGIIVRCEAGRAASVKSVSSGGAADLSGEVLVGDLLLQIDGKGVQVTRPWHLFKP
jgi:C-terminal processing protease CtpA/Prc